MLLKVNFQLKEILINTTKVIRIQLWQLIFLTYICNTLYTHTYICTYIYIYIYRYTELYIGKDRDSRSHLRSLQYNAISRMCYWMPLLKSCIYSCIYLLYISYFTMLYLYPNIYFEVSLGCMVAIRATVFDLLRHWSIMPSL